MGQCRTLDADVVIMVITVHPFLRPFFIWNNFFPLTLVESKGRRCAAKVVVLVGERAKRARHYQGCTNSS